MYILSHLITMIYPMNRILGCTDHSPLLHACYSMQVTVILPCLAGWNIISKILYIKKSSYHL